MLLYVLPVAFAAGGVAFPIGVLVYWTTTNIWTMGQQFYVIRRNPTPGSAAYEELQARRAASAKAALVAGGGTSEVAETPVPEAPKRQQPKRQSRSQRRPGRPSTPPTGPGSSGGPSDDNQEAS
jgi:YidC/Oxa1 family membrane protein insertase